MKRLLTILLTIIAIQANAQFKFNGGKATANMDTLGTRNDTLFLRNRVTGEVSYIIPENGETITTREKVATQIGDSVANKLKASDTLLFVSTTHDDAILDNKISKLSDLQVTQRYYLDLTASDISTYSQLVPDPIIYSGKDSTVTINNNTVLIAAFATNLNKPNVDTIPTGQWAFRFFASISAITGDNYIHFDVYKRNLAGVETFLFRTSTPDILVTTQTEYLLEQIKPAVSITPDDRLVVKVSAQTTGVTKTATFHYSNSEKFAFVQPPLTFSIPESDPKYAVDSSYIKQNIRALNDSIDSLRVDIGSSMVYPGAGIPLSTGSAWGTSFPVSRLDSTYNTLKVGIGNDSITINSNGINQYDNGNRMINTSIYANSSPYMFFNSPGEASLGIGPTYIYSMLNHNAYAYNNFPYSYWAMYMGDTMQFKIGRVGTSGTQNHFAVTYNNTIMQVSNNDTVFKTDVSGNLDITGEYRINGVPIGSGGIVLPDSFSISRRGVDFDSIVGLKLDRSESWYYNDTIRDTLRIHVDTSQIGGSANITFVADSTYTPTVDVLSRDATPVQIEQDAASDPYDNTQGHRNEFFIYRNGDRIWWSWKNRD